MSINRLLVILIIVMLVLIFFVRRYRQASPHLNVEPHAREEIEKAKRR